MHLASPDRGFAKGHFFFFWPVTASVAELLVWGSKARCQRYRAAFPDSLYRALTISQLGETAAPVVLAFGLAPAVVRGAHFYTLLHYDMLVRIVRLAVFQMAERLLVFPQSLRLPRCQDIAPGAQRADRLRWWLLPSPSPVAGSRPPPAEARMPDILLDRIKELSPTLALIVVIALGAAGIAMWFQEGALKEPGHDRDRLVRSLRLGGDLRRHYVFWVSRALNRVDRFLGDDGKAEWSLRVRLIDNHRPAPYWTGWSFDKCALLAVVYPLAAMFCTWAWAGEAGDRRRPWVRCGHVVLAACDRFGLRGWLRYSNY